MSSYEIKDAKGHQDCKRPNNSHIDNWEKGGNDWDTDAVHSSFSSLRRGSNREQSRVTMAI